MASSSTTSLFHLTLLFALAMAPFSAQAGGQKETKLVMYLHDVSNGPQATSLPIAGIEGKARAFSEWGTTYVTDDPITEGPHLNTATIGRAQGISVTAAKNGLHALVMVSLVFTNKEYNGSTLELRGNSKQFEEVREIPVVSGTGKFRFTRGYATVETHFLHKPTAYHVKRLNVSVLHDF